MYNFLCNLPLAFFYFCLIQDQKNHNLHTPNFMQLCNFYATSSFNKGPLNLVKILHIVSTSARLLLAYNVCIDQSLSNQAVSRFQFYAIKNQYHFVVSDQAFQVFSLSLSLSFCLFVRDQPLQNAMSQSSSSAHFALHTCTLGTSL